MKKLLFLLLLPTICISQKVYKVFKEPTAQRLTYYKVALKEVPLAVKGGRYAMMDVDTSVTNDILKNNIQSLSFEIPDPDIKITATKKRQKPKKIKLNLYRVYYDTKTISFDGKKEKIFKPNSKNIIQHFRGTIAGDTSKNLVAISITPDDVFGIASNRKGNINFGRIRGQKAAHIVCYDKDLAGKNPFECGVTMQEIKEQCIINKIRGNEILGSKEMKEIFLQNLQQTFLENK